MQRGGQGPGKYEVVAVGVVTHLDEHLRWMRRAGRVETTVAARAACLLRLSEHLGHDPATATEAELEAWQDTLPRHRIRNSTAMIRPYFRWLHQKGYRPDDPAALLVTPRAKPGIPRPITMADLTRALETAPPRVLPWLLLAAWSGLRAKEVAALRAEDFVHHDGRTFIRLTVTKGGRPRTSVVPGWVWAVLAPMLPASGPCWRRERGTGPVTAQHVSQLANNHLRAQRIPSTFHALRHWAGTEALEASGNLRLVQELLGHQDPTSTQVYTAVRPIRLHDLAESLPRPPGSRRLTVVRESA
ncbi:hypothetical protein GCM10027047_01890 [Rhodococcus aerolatus]